MSIPGNKLLCLMSYSVQYPFSALEFSAYLYCIC
jgi:hypothetical protein